MKKMPCLFQRDFSDKRNPVLLRDVTPGCEWVLDGRGTASRKRDGTACAIFCAQFGYAALYKRYDAKRGKTPPPDSIPCGDPDTVTGHWPHWVPVGSEPESQWHRDAWESDEASKLEEGTFELCGPKVQGNPEKLDAHRFFRHGAEVLVVPRTFDGLREYLEANRMEGIVFLHEDGQQRCKIRRHDYGLQWP